jgi:formylglycine-generating enzyme required for sulfatase activity
MSGNVWEWTASAYDSERLYSIVRGGSWIFGQRYARCTRREKLWPGEFTGNVGFRVISRTSE